MTVGLVLSGGGARGAYEVGVLLRLAEQAPELLERIRVITGSSVGAVNGVFLASRGVTVEAVRELADLWRGLTLDGLLSLSSMDALRMLGAAPLRLLRKKAPSPARGILDGGGLWRLVSKEIRWEDLHAHVRSGRLDAVAITGTDLASGRSHVFYEQTPDRALPADCNEAVYLQARLTRRHVLASAAIPLLFPPIRVGGRWYIDGGVRNNTPFGPALRFGATSLIIVNTRGGREDLPVSPQFPGIGQTVGKVLDAIFLDRVAFDLDRLQRINDFVQIAEELGQAEALATALAARGRPPYRHVPFAVVGPSSDLGKHAAGYIEAHDRLASLGFLRVLGALFSSDAQSSGDGASFLLFDGGYASKLIDAGYDDAAGAFAALR